ncbi:MAG TPA: hypothetical protein VH306_08725 [Gaiellaceae bacterium]|jgi:hypothetical protein
MSRTFKTLGALMIVSGLIVSNAAASVKVGSSARKATLKVTSAGYAEVIYVTNGGKWRHVLIRPNGSLRFGGHTNRKNVAYRTTGVKLPLRAQVYRTPNGTFYALQRWRRLVGRPVELRFSRWQGAPTRLNLRTVCCKWSSERVMGNVTYHGKGVWGTNNTPTGAPKDGKGRNVYLDSRRNGHWKRMMGILTHPKTGWYRLWIRPYWRGGMYRGAVIGPNWGRTFAPDARSSATTKL